MQYPVVSLNVNGDFSAVVGGSGIFENQLVRALRDVVRGILSSGAVVSSTVMICVASVLLPQSSIAVNVRVTV